MDNISHRLRLIAFVEPIVRAYLSAASRSRDEREELHRDVIADLYTALPPDASDELAVTLALAAARRVARRCKQRERRLISARDPDTVPQGADREEVRRYRQLLWQYEERLLGQLSQGQRAALELHIMDGLSDRDIAALTGLSVRSLPQLRHSAKNVCRSLITRGIVPSPPTPET